MRRPGILAGIDNVRVQPIADDPCLGELMSRFLTFKRSKSHAGELSLTTPGRLRVQTLKNNRSAIAKDGDSALVFVTRRGRPYYSEHETYRHVKVGEANVRKLAGVSVSNAITLTFTRMAKDLGLEGVTFYRLRHTFRTAAARSRDREAIDLMMGHRDRSIGKLYSHEEVSWCRVRHVARIVYRRLWPKMKSSGDVATESNARKRVRRTTEFVLTSL